MLSPNQSKKPTKYPVSSLSVRLDQRVVVADAAFGCELQAFKSTDAHTGTKVAFDCTTETKKRRTSLQTCSSRYM